MRIPAGATATQVEVYYVDEHASNICVLVMESKPSAATWRTLHPDPVCTVGALPESRTLTIPLPANTITGSEVLFVAVSIPVENIGLRVYGARVKYRRP